MKSIFFSCFIILGFSSCSKDGTAVYEPVPYELDIPEFFEQNVLSPIIPLNNPQTKEGVSLGKKLFFDPQLSVDSSISCADCHAPENSFSDKDRFSDGVNGTFGNRNSMPLFNLAWNFDERFFWDGSAFSLEDQISHPITDTEEMSNSWDNVVATLEANPQYP
ncbi:MAG: cytochrome-c peroxidase, partial [Pricia sp.]|nr:cytochrome-c peroxidase [Pricia sp.]